MGADSRVIPLRVTNKTAYVWDVDDIATIRSKHHICGVLTGTLPHLSQQNVFLGVPLVLMPEEAVLLIEIGAAVLIDDPTAYKQPTVPHLQHWSQEQQDSIKTQLAHAETKVVKESKQAGRAMSEEALLKRKAREERKKAQATAKAAAEAAEDGDPSIVLASASGSPSSAAPPSTEQVARISATPEPTTRLPEHAPKGTSLPYTIVIPASSLSLEWYDADACTYTTIESAKAARIWDYPSNLSERARCGVFKHLWKQGYFMGGGIKFGGQYLVYPGDPLRYHSHFTATVIESPVASLRPMEIVAHGRLGTATKKAHLLCGWDDEKQEASYISIEWAGFG
ncbi:unnamed protein product [Cyclocybe aegerita]|uniref:tRNA-splicing endonuclease subunit Sen34 n=1 Tax=Cyclocybe aegerita TaxID=1973307 RepID=A0A8S0W714_CYCAE|nr:unnamed protein product [Cyclocybe aegerita]